MSRARIAMLSLAVALAACDAVTDPTTSTSPLIPGGVQSVDTTTHLAMSKASPVTAPGIPLGYSATQLPLVPGGINDSGVVVGSVSPGGGALTKAARWLNGALVTLSTNANWPGNYEARAINYRGSIVGRVVGGPGMYWTSTNFAPQVIESPYGPDYNRAVIPEAVNNDEVVVGSYDHIDRERTPDRHAFRWSARDGFEDITPDGYDNAVALDVNDAGYAVGYAWRWGERPDAVRWEPGPGNQVVVLEKLGRARAVRANGVSVGTTVGTLGAYIDTPWAWGFPGGSAPLAAPLASEVDDASNTGRVVGYTFVYAGVNPKRPWTVFDGATEWLPVPDERETDRVTDLRVNACGSIVARQAYANGTVRGLLWTRFKCDLLPPTPW
jgi:hypothetical protein